MLFVKVWCICFMMFSREAMDTAGYKSRITDIRSNIRCGRIPDICITDSKLLFDETYFNTFHELTLCSLYNNCTLVLSSLESFCPLFIWAKQLGIRFTKSPDYPAGLSSNWITDVVLLNGSTSSYVRDNIGLNPNILPIYSNSTAKY